MKKIWWKNDAVRALVFWAVTTLTSSVSSHAAAEKTSKQSISGHLVLEYRYFPDSPLVSEQADQGLSFAVQPEFYKKFDGSNTSLTFVPFARVDRYDKERSHNDIRELMVHTIRPNWELRTGVGKVFWGVTESQHLVDVINQTDAVEATDGEEKLGQPMVNLTLKRPWGTTDLFVLPYFRERTFPGVRGRPRSVPLVDTSLTQYESSRMTTAREIKHINSRACVLIWQPGSNRKHALWCPYKFM